VPVFCASGNNLARWLYAPTTDKGGIVINNLENNNIWDEENIASQADDAVAKDAQEDELPPDFEGKDTVNMAQAATKKSAPKVSFDDDLDAIDIHLGVVITPDEYTPENVAILKKNLLAQKSIKFCSEQFNDRVIHYNIVGVDIMPDAVTSLMGEVIGDDVQLDRDTYSNSVNIVIDIGSGTTDMAAIQGFDVIPDSEKQFTFATNDAFVDIAQEIEKKYNCGYIEAAYVANIVRYPLGVCPGCDSVSANSKTCSCGQEYEMKRNMIRIGRQTFDVSDIVEAVFEEKTDALTNIFKRYLDAIFKVRGINRSTLDTILIVGGGAELFGRMLKEKITSFVGEYVEIKKVNKAVWKSVNGLGKYVMLKKSRVKKNFKRYVFVDVGNYATKAKLVDLEHNEVGKPVELLTRVSTPVELGDISLRKVHPMMDLWLEVSSRDEGEHMGNGSYFVSHLANKGRNIKIRNSLTPKTLDDMVYVMINSAIGVLLARDKSTDM